MLSDFLKKNIKSQANYVEYGYGQVEPNHLSAQRTAQIYAQLPAAASIPVLEQGQFVKYDYAAANGGEVNFTGAGEWMLVYNEIKLYREHQIDCEFALVKDNYEARVYSPYDWSKPEEDKQSLYYNGKDSKGHTSMTIEATGGESPEKRNVTFNYDDVTAAPDMYEIHYNEDPFHFLGKYQERMMAPGTKMVPRVFKTNIGDIFTTNTINFADNDGAPKLGGLLCVGEDGILTEEAHAGSHAGTMRWQIVRIYTMPDNQKGVKIMRVA